MAELRFYYALWKSTVWLSSIGVRSEILGFSLVVKMPYIKANSVRSLGEQYCSSSEDLINFLYPYSCNLFGFCLIFNYVIDVRFDFSVKLMTGTVTKGFLGVKILKESFWSALAITESNLFNYVYYLSSFVLKTPQLPY